MSHYDDEFEGPDYGDGPDRPCPWYDDDNDEDDIDGVGFADPGGRSALRAATPENPRNLPCPNCGAEDVLTPLDALHGYQCDACADRAEQGC